MCVRGWLVPPFASDQNESLDSVFENKGLLKSVKVQLLDVQCKSTLLCSSFYPSSLLNTRFFAYPNFLIINNNRPNATCDRRLPF